MKKILILILFLFSVCSLLTYSQIQTINVGTVANDGTGDPLRTAFIKANNNFSYHSGLFALKANLASPSFTGTVVLPATTSIGNVSATEISYLDGAVSNIQAQLYDTTSLSVVGFTKADTNKVAGKTELATMNDLLNFEGGGTIGKFYTLKGITGVTQGIPGSGDSLIIHTNFIGKNVNFFREGQLQQQHPNNTETDGYWFNNTTGTLTVKPVFGANEQIEIWSTNTILWEALVPQGGPGGGGDPPETPLLERLISYYTLDEASGTTATDSHGDNNGTHNGAMVPAAGVLGYAVSYDGDQDNTTIPYSAELVPADSMAVSLWVKISTLPSAKGHLGYAYIQRHSVAPWRSVGILIDTDNEIWGFFVDADGDEFWVNYSTPVTVGPWYHIVLVNRGDGNDVELWVNGVLRDTAPAFDGTMLASTSYASLGNGTQDGSTGLSCIIDEVYISEGIDPTGIVTLYGDGTPPSYPFTP